MRFTIGKKMYTTASIDEISLKSLIVFNRQAEEFGIPERWADIELLAEQFSEMTPDECDAHEAKWLVLGVTIWASRTIAGDDVTLSEAVDIQMKDLTFIADPQDRKPGKAKASAKKRAAPKKPGSGQAGAHATPLDETPTTSGEKSNDD